MAQNLDPQLLARLLQGESVDGYQMGRGNAIWNPNLSADQQDPNAFEDVIYGGTSKDGWATNNWNTWNKDGTYRGTGSGDSDALSTLKFLATAAAGYYGAGALNGAETAATGAGSGGVNWGTVASNAGRSAAMNGGMTLARGGDLGDALKSAAVGGVTGAVGGGLSSYGVNPIVANAATGATGAALRGGDGKDILLGGATGALSGAGNSGAFTGNPLVDRAIAAGGNTLIRGGNASDALRGGLFTGATGLLNGGGSAKSLTDANSDALSEDNIVRFDGSNTVDDFDWEAWIQEQMNGSNRGTDPYQFNWEDLGVDVGTDYSNEGRNYPTTTSTQGPGGSPINSGGGGVNPPPPNSGTPDLGKWLATILGAGLGANSSRDQQQTNTREPWAPAQPMLKGLISEGNDLYNQYKAQPFNGAQKAGYNNMAGLLDLVNKNAGGLLSGAQANASGQNQFVRGQPRGLIGSSFNPSPQEWNPQSYGRFGG